MALPARPLPRRPGEALPFLLQNAAGYVTAKHFLAEFEVDAVVGLGGYASVPMARAAAARGVPLLLLEQNVHPGRATRWLAPRADMVCVAFDAALERLTRRSDGVEVTGTPLRSGFSSARESALSGRIGGPASSQAAPAGKRRLLVLGGSGGATALNQSVPRALYRIRKQLEGWTIHHQTGPDEAEAAAGLYRRFGLSALVEPFIDDMPAAMAAAELALCRSGGSTLAELAVTETPAVLVPYPEAADDHQRRNAEWFAEAGAARVVDQRRTAARLDVHLAAAVAEILSDRPLRDGMAAVMRRVARPRAAETIAGLLLERIARGRLGRRRQTSTSRRCA